MFNFVVRAILLDALAWLYMLKFWSPSFPWNFYRLCFDRWNLEQYCKVVQSERMVWKSFLVFYLFIKIWCADQQSPFLTMLTVFFSLLVFAIQIQTILEFSPSIPPARKALCPHSSIHRPIFINHNHPVSPIGRTFSIPWPLRLPLRNFTTASLCIPLMVSHRRTSHFHNTCPMIMHPLGWHFIPPCSLAAADFALPHSFGRGNLMGLNPESGCVGTVLPKQYPLVNIPTRTPMVRKMHLPE